MHISFARLSWTLKMCLDEFKFQLTLPYVLQSDVRRFGGKVYAPFRFGARIRVLSEHEHAERTHALSQRWFKIWK